MTHIFRRQWRLLENVRARRDAPVDIMGCDRLGNKLAAPSTFRLETLIAGVLSAQTRDEVTAGAVQRMRRAATALDEGQAPGPSGAISRESDGISIQWLLDVPAEELEQLLVPVSFHTRKADYLKRAAQILRDKHADDVPDTFTGLKELPGVGNKIAFLVLSAAFGKHEGICVDTHVHRISNRLGWVQRAGSAAGTKTPEQTRVALEKWMPPELWWECNTLLVGFGQQVCSAVQPKCGVCPLADEGVCPSAPGAGTR